MKNSTNRALLFQQRRQERHASLATRLTLPSSGVEVLVARPDLEVWIMSGRLPQALTAKVLELFGKGENPSPAAVLKSMQEAGGTAMMDSLVFVREFVRATLVSPRLVVPALDGRHADPEKDEIAPEDLDKDDFIYILHWAMGGGGGAPVQTEGGEVTHDALATFRDKRRGRSAGADKS